MDGVFSYPARFALKIFWFGFIAIIVILFIRIGYCYAVANSSLDELTPQIARYVAEYNGTPINNDRYKQEMEGLGQLLITASSVSDGSAAGTKRKNAAFQYKINGSHAYGKNANTIVQALKDGKGVSGNNSLRVYSSKTGKKLLCDDPKSSDTSIKSYMVAQRGEIINIELTVWVTVTSDWSVNGTKILKGLEFPITKQMSIPAIKYYRGL